MHKQFDNSLSNIPLSSRTKEEENHPTSLTSSVGEEPILTLAPATDSDGIPLSRMKKSVSFHSVEIAEHPMELGDNPSANGLPLTLGWECDFKFIFQLEEYETSKPEPRSQAEFWIPPHIRKDLLSRQGVTASEMLRTSKEMSRIKNSRHRSNNQNQRWEKVHQVIEESAKKLKKIIPTYSSPLSLGPRLEGASCISPTSSPLQKFVLRKSKSTPNLSTHNELDHCRRSLSTEDLMTLLDNSETPTAVPSDRSLDHVAAVNKNIIQAVEPDEDEDSIIFI